MSVNKRNNKKGVKLVIFILFGVIFSFTCLIPLLNYIQGFYVNLQGLVATPTGPAPALVTNLTLLPLPDVAITPGPAVTPDWENDNTYFRRDLNSEVQIYSNRFGLQWLADDYFRLTRVVSEGQYRSYGYVRQVGAINERQWNYNILFPWPSEPFTGQVTYTIDGTIARSSVDTMDDNSRGPAVAAFEEPDPQNPSGFVLGECRYHVHGQITLTSYSPVVGHFQFACQFDSQEYALVSGRFWE